jgi:coenzyme F420 hydrogenase subunit beta
MTMADASAAITAQPAVSLDRLKGEVLDTGLCVSCGACVGLCPHMIFYDGAVAAPDDCGLSQGRCYDLCPQALEPGQIAKRKALHDKAGQEYAPPLGPYISAWQAKATAQDIEGRAQYGGVVSALMALALDLGMVEEAVLTKSGMRGAPEGARVRDRAGVLDTAGSIYAAGASLMSLNQALAEEATHKLGLVGLPCQVMAAAAMKAHPDYPAAQRLGLVIGLFCTWNLSARGLRALLAAEDVSGPVIKYDIPPPPAEVFQIETGSGVTEIPLAKVREKTLPGCALCPDMTAELADLSVGAVEGIPGWNTLMVRTETADSLLREAEKQGLIILEDPNPESLDHLRQAAEGKRSRAAQAWKER